MDVWHRTFIKVKREEVENLGEDGVNGAKERERKEYRSRTNDEGMELGDKDLDGLIVSSEWKRRWD